MVGWNWTVVVLDVCDYFFFFKQKTAYEMRISDWSSDVCSSDLPDVRLDGREIFAGLRVDIVGETNAAPDGRDHEIVAELDAARAGALDAVVAADRAAATGQGAPCGRRAHRARALEAVAGEESTVLAVAIGRGSWWEGGCQ